MAQDVPPNHERVEIDTSLPFHSVKAAVTMFGEKADTKKKLGSKEAELHQLKGELANAKLQLAAAEKAKAWAFAELKDSKMLLEEMTKGFVGPILLNQTEKRDMPMANCVKQSSLNTEEKHVVWEVELKVAQEQHMTVVAELELTKKELEKLRQELAISLSEKEHALRQAEEALSSAELNARRVEELSHEISGTNESLVLVKLACIEASKERTALLAAKSGGDRRVQSGAEHDMNVVQELENKLAVATAELTKLQPELASAKEAEDKATKAVSEAYANLNHVKSELEKMRTEAHGMNLSSIALSCELKSVKKELEKALEDGASLQATMETLQTELESMRKEIADLRTREANASAAVESLTGELSRTKNELTNAVTSETKANEAIADLTRTLQQITREAEESKANAFMLKEEAKKARVDSEQAKAALINSEQELETAIRAAEAAKAAEGEALERFKVFSEQTSAARASEVEAGAGISISREEYDQLKKKVSDAEELANMRVAAANAQVEAAKIGKLELQQKLKTVNEDIEIMKRNTKQALQRAEMADSAKLAVECEMRRWREREQHAKGGEMVVMASQKSYAKMGSKSQPLSYYSDAQPESLAQILNMKMPSAMVSNAARTLSDRTLGQKKKKHLLPTLSTILGKKNQSLTGNLMET